MSDAHLISPASSGRANFWAPAPGALSLQDMPLHVSDGFGTEPSFPGFSRKTDKVLQVDFDDQGDATITFERDGWRRQIRLEDALHQDPLLAARWVALPDSSATVPWAFDLRQGHAGGLRVDRYDAQRARFLVKDGERQLWLKPGLVAALLTAGDHTPSIGGDRRRTRSVAEFTREMLGGTPGRRGFLTTRLHTEKPNVLEPSVKRLSPEVALPLIKQMCTQSASVDPEEPNNIDHIISVLEGELVGVQSTLGTPLSQDVFDALAFATSMTDLTGKGGDIFRMGGMKVAPTKDVHPNAPVLSDKEKLARASQAETAGEVWFRQLAKYGRFYQRDPENDADFPPDFLAPVLWHGMPHFEILVAVLNEVNELRHDSGMGDLVPPRIPGDRDIRGKTFDFGRWGGVRALHESDLPSPAQEFYEAILVHHFTCFPAWMLDRAHLRLDFDAMVEQGHLTALQACRIERLVEAAIPYNRAIRAVVAARRNDLPITDNMAHALEQASEEMSTALCVGQRPLGDPRRIPFWIVGEYNFDLIYQFLPSTGPFRGSAGKWVHIVYNQQAAPLAQKAQVPLSGRLFLEQFAKTMTELYLEAKGWGQRLVRDQSVGADKEVWEDLGELFRLVSHETANRLGLVFDQDLDGYRLAEPKEPAYESMNALLRNHWINLRFNSFRSSHPEADPHDRVDWFRDHLLFGPDDESGAEILSEIDQLLTTSPVLSEPPSPYE